MTDRAMKIASALEDIGLTDKEAKIYLALLELHEALPTVVARRARTKRPTTYDILDQLQKRGLVSRFRRGSRTYYRALNPYALLEDQHKRYSALEKVMPELVQLHERYAVTPQMSVYEGRDGVIQVMEDTLKTSTELLCWGDTTQTLEPLLRDYYPHYIETKVKRKIWLRGVFNYSQIGLKFKKRGKEELREVYLIPREEFPFKNEINIYDDKVAIVSHEDEVGVIIQNQNIADTQRAIFQLGFRYAKILEQDVLTKKDREYLNS